MGSCEQLSLFSSAMILRIELYNHKNLQPIFIILNIYCRLRMSYLIRGCAWVQLHET